MNRTIVAAFGTTFIIIANERCGRFESKRYTDVKFAVVDQKFAAVDQKFAAVDQKLAAVDQKFAAIDQKFAAVNQKLNELHVGQDFITRMLVSSAVKTMKALDGDKSEMRSFVKEMEEMVKCFDGGEDCKGGGGGGD